MIQRVGYIAVSATVIGALAAVGVLAKTTPAADAAAASSSVTISSKAIQLSQPTDPMIGRLTPSKSAASTGMFAPQIDLPTIPIHLAVARNGNLISYGAPLGVGTTQAGLIFDSWNPALGIGSQAHADSDSMGYDSFCNSLVTLEDGRLLMVGGNSSMSTMIYDPTTGSTVKGEDLNLQRWYATTLRLPSGQIIVLGGTDTYNRHTTLGLPPGFTDGTTPEIGSGTGAWRELSGAASAAAFGRYNSKWFYPRAFIGPQGQVVGFSNDQLWELATAGSGKIKLTGTLPYKPYASESQVMYAPGKVLVASGGSGAPDGHTYASKRAVTIDFNFSKPKVKSTGNVLYPGHWLNLTVLPSGEVFANGGTGYGTTAKSADYTAEIWNPSTGKWRPAASAKRIRTYHSTSLLMPSGAVFTGGGGDGPYTDGSGPGPENNLNAELYYPAYLFAKDAKGAVHWAPRPKIASISGSLTYGKVVKLGVAGAASRVKSASLITLPSVTHSQNTDQRRVALSLSQKGQTVSVKIPSSIGTLPPGDYELTVTNDKGVPSPAQIVTIKRHGSGFVTLAGKSLPASTAPSPMASMAMN